MLKILFVVFITLKLSNVIDWSWLIVFSPIIISFILIIIKTILELIIESL